MREIVKFNSIAVLEGFRDSALLGTLAPTRFRKVSRKSNLKSVKGNPISFNVIGCTFQQASKLQFVIDAFLTALGPQMMH